MARIRSIKPETSADKTLAACSFPARYTFLLVISQADDYGLLGAEPRQLLGALYPHDATVTEPMLLGWVGELVECGRLRWRMTKDGARVLEVVNWAKHQKVKNPGKPLLRDRLQPFSADHTPTRPPSSGNPPETLPSSSGGTPEGLPSSSVGLGGAERERERERDREKGEGKGRGTPTAADAAARGFDVAWRLYPRRPGDVRAKALRAWCARVRSGVSPEALLAGVRAYAAHVERQRLRPNWDPHFIKQAATFFGPDRHWEADWGPPTDDLIPVYDERGEMTREAALALGVVR